MALDAAQAGGIVHRDVKPGNLLLDADGNVHVADFGVARATGMDSLTVAGTVLGTAGYLSPEQARGEQAGPASDRYALGVLAFELLTGERPFQRDTTAAEAAAHVHEPVPSIHDRNPSLPPALDRCFRRALAKDPARRFESNYGVRHARCATPSPSPGVAVAPRPRRLAGTAPFPASVADPGDRRACSRPPRSSARCSPRRSWTAARRARTPRTAPVTTQAPVTTRAPVTEPADRRRRRRRRRLRLRRPPTPAAESPAALTDRATTLMRQGRFGEALPIAQQALAALQGSGQLYEAYANYDVGRSLIELGRCEEGVPYIEASRRIQGSRAEFREALELCRGNGKKKAKKKKDD